MPRLPAAAKPRWRWLPALAALILLALPPDWATHPASAGSEADVVFPVTRGTLVTAKGRFRLFLEFAVTPAQRAHGLMFRRSLPEGFGMLFDFGSTGAVAMWMKNTLIPLDMLFFDARGRVVGLIAGAEPLSEKVLSPGVPARAVLELPAGAIARYGVRVGDMLEHRMFEAG